MKQTKNNYETKTVTPHSLYLEYIKKVILEMGNFTKWTFKTVSFGNVEPYEISEYTLNNSYAIINLSKKTIEIKSGKNLYLLDKELLYGLIIKLEKIKTSSNNYDFVLSLKNMISDDLSKSFWEGVEPSFATQEGRFQNLIPMNMFSYINPNFKDKDLFDGEILEIIRTLFSEENVENAVMSREPENLSRYMLSTLPSDPKRFLTEFEYYLNYFSKELILKSFAANNKSKWKVKTTTGWLSTLVGTTVMHKTIFVITGETEEYLSSNLARYKKSISGLGVDFFCLFFYNY